MTIDEHAQWLGMVLAAVPHFIIVVDRSGTIRYVNRVEPGYDPLEVVGTHSSTIVAPESVGILEAALRSVFSTGKTEEYEVEIPAADGSSQWYRSQIFPLGADAHPESAVIVASNVTELKRAQEEADRLRQLVPLCAWCDRIWTGEDTWQTVEAYLEASTGSRVTHGICSDCMEKQLGEQGDAGDSDGDAA